MRLMTTTLKVLGRFHFPFKGALADMFLTSTDFVTEAHRMASVRAAA